MSPAAPIPAPLALCEEGLAGWQRFHQDAMARMSDLAIALDRQGWPGVERACRWVHETFHPHHQWEEQHLFPLLAQVGRGPLGAQLKREHREMRRLTRAILEGNAGGRVADPGPHGLRARRLLDLVRQHLDTEVHGLLPLFQGLPPAGPDPCGAGYQAPPTTRRPNPAPAGMEPGGRQRH